jgi:hypothetical protein
MAPHRKALDPLELSSYRTRSLWTLCPTIPQAEVAPCQ